LNFKWTPLHIRPTYMVDHMYTQFWLVQNSTCIGPGGTQLLRETGSVCNSISSSIAVLKLGGSCLHRTMFIYVLQSSLCFLTRFNENSRHVTEMGRRIMKSRQFTHSYWDGVPQMVTITAFQMPSEAEAHNFMSVQALWPNTRDFMEVMLQHLSLNSHSLCNYKRMSAGITPTSAMAMLQDYRK
jgi:hypothetical protein